MKNLTGILLFIMLIVISTDDYASAEQTRRPKVRNVTYTGNSTFDKARLEGLMLTRTSRFLATSRFHPEIFSDDLETLLSFYKQNGFLQVQIVDTLITIDSLHNHVDIEIQLEEGQRTYIENISVLGGYFFPDSVLMRYIRLKKGDPLRRPVIEDAVVALLSSYAEKGFLEASVTPKVEVNDSLHLALVFFAIHEGVRSRVGSISITGAEKSNPNIILRELSFAKGDTVKYSELISSQQRLYLTGLFESVFVRPGLSVAGDSTEREIRVEVKERQSGELSISFGYGTVEKFRGRTELSISNLSGTARKVSFGAEANFIKQGLSLSFSEPWTFGTRWKSDFSLFGQLLQEPAYHAEMIGGKLTIGRKIGMKTSVALSYRLENTNLSSIELAAPVEKLDPRIRSLALTISHDTRDNFFDPSVGWYANWSNEIAGSFLKGSNTFVKTVMTLKRFEPLGRHAVIGSALEFGWMQSFGGSDEIPLSERFYTGGPTTLRGYGYQLVGPLDSNGEPLGGRLKLVFNVIELRRSIYRIFGGALFFEFGNVWSDPRRAQLSDLRANVGAGLRVNSPLGILRLDYGFNIDRQGDEPRTKIFFSMGQAF